MGLAEPSPVGHVNDRHLRALRRPLHSSRCDRCAPMLGLGCVRAHRSSTAADQESEHAARTRSRSLTLLSAWHLAPQRMSSASDGGCLMSSSSDFVSSRLPSAGSGCASSPSSAERRRLHAVHCLQLRALERVHAWQRAAFSGASDEQRRALLLRWFQSASTPSSVTSSTTPTSLSSLLKQLQSYQPTSLISSSTQSQSALDSSNSSSTPTWLPSHSPSLARLLYSSSSSDSSGTYWPSSHSCESRPSPPHRSDMSSSHAPSQLFDALLSAKEGAVLGEAALPASCTASAAPPTLDAWSHPSGAVQWLADV